jgi:hypothetical protein
LLLFEVGLAMPVVKEISTSVSARVTYMLGEGFLGVKLWIHGKDSMFREGGGRLEQEDAVARAP